MLASERHLYGDGGKLAESTVSFRSTLGTGLDFGACRRLSSEANQAL